ncbi:hypothetical protein [Formosa sp. S-31]|uniref:hypothetical protein n=1 Tax=Formosa sp. S-31 TaxID=2790949 RepID=UPI003EBA05DE
MGKGTGIQLIGDPSAGEVLDLMINVVRDSQNKIVSGVVVGHTLQQNKGIMLLATQGEIKWRPDLGVGIEDLVLNEDYLEYRHKIREHFAKDGLRVSKVSLYENKPFEIIADYDS